MNGGQKMVKTPSSSSKESSSSQGSIDVYAVQCERCMKWRVVDTQEEFEEIRHKVIEEPFYCSKKANSSCDEPADIDYDPTRTWAIDKHNLPKTPKGFKKSLVIRKDHSRLDVYCITPAGKKLRSRKEIAIFLNNDPQYEGLSVSDFGFSSPKIIDETIPENFQLKDSSIKKVKPPKK